MSALRYGLLMAGMLGLSACAGGTGPLFDPPIPQAAPQPAVGGSTIGGVFVPDVPKSAVTAAQLASETAGDVKAVLGPAELIRREGDNAVWQYRAGECVVDLFFAGSEETARLAHMEQRGAESLDACLSEMSSL